MTALDHARAYLARGWSVIPLVPGTKRPAVELRPFLTGELRLNEEHLRRYWPETTGESFGIGIICGQPSGGLVVIDVDPRNGGSVGIAIAQTDSACRVETGGGGLHIYCRADGVVPKGKTARPGVDRQGDGGYVVAPPSVHPDTGRAYEWLCDVDQPLGPVPAWALDRPAPPPTDGAPSEPWVASTLEHPERCEPGTQEETLTRLAWWAAGALDRDIAEAVLGRWLGCLTLGNPRHPWTSEDLRRKLDSAYAKREPEFAVESAASSAAAQTTHGVNDSHAEVPADAFSPLATLDFPDQDWVVEDFVAPGAFTEVIGKVKKGKSTLVYQLVRSVLTGEDFLGRKVTPGPVVVLTEQEGASLRATLARAGLYGTALPLVVVRKAQLARLGPWAAAIPKVVDLALWLGARLVVVDTLSRLARMLGDAENKAGAVAALDPFDRARAAGLACAFVRHARKGAPGAEDDSADAARGSSAITGDMDIVIRHRPHPGGGDVRVLSWESRLADDPEDVALRYEGGRYEVTEMPAGKQAARRHDRVAEMRAALAEGCRTFAALQARLGWSPHTIAKYRRLAEEGERLPQPPDEGDGRVAL